MIEPGYGKVFGPNHLGKIQGTAQAIRVVASARGPKLLAETEVATGEYWLAFHCLGFGALGLTVLAWLTPMPSRAYPELLR